MLDVTRWGPPTQCKPVGVCLTVYESCGPSCSTIESAFMKYLGLLNSTNKVDLVDLAQGELELLCVLHFEDGDKVTAKGKKLAKSTLRTKNCRFARWMLPLFCLIPPTIPALR